MARTASEIPIKARDLAIVAALAFSPVALAQVAGSASVGATVSELRAVAEGWSAEKQILGKPVFNEQNERVGSIGDIIIAPDRAVSYAIVGAGGFLGLGKHDVAIPVNQLRLQQNGQETRFVLPGATKEALKSLPQFEYAK